VNALTLLRGAFADLHKEFIEDLQGMEDDDLFWQPAPGVNHAGFLAWHVARDEDTVICQAVLRTPELWKRESWDKRFAMDSTEQGTGLAPERLETFRYPVPLLFEYAQAVWRQTDAALSAMPEQRLGEDLPWSSDWRLANLLTTGCLSHGWVHLGEIRQLRGLLGWRFRE
jgi:hypothetical protein